MKKIAKITFVTIVCIILACTIFILLKDNKNQNFENIKERKLQIKKIDKNSKKNTENLNCLINYDKKIISNKKIGTRTESMNKDYQFFNDEVVIIVNNNSNISKEIGNYYAEKRNISKEQICIVNTSIAEIIERDEYNDLEEQVKKFLSNNDLINKTKYLLTTKEIPLKINGTNAKPPFDYYGNCSSVDSELALIFSSMQSGNNGKYDNPYFKADEHFKRDNYDIYLVNRLTGLNIDDAKALVDRAIAGEENVLGRGYFDADSAMIGEYRWYDDLINESFYLVKEYGFDCGLEKSAIDIGMKGAKYSSDSSPNLLHANETATNALLYWGWYSNSTYYDTFNWSIGALGQRLHSFNAKSFNSNFWCAGAVADGITGTMGNVYEPFLDAAHYPTIFFDRILKGYSFGEASYMSQPYLSWQSVVIGDPLYTPFRYDVNLSCKNDMHFVEPKNSTSFTIIIRNDGNLKNEIELKKENIPVGWVVELNQTNIFLEKGETANITINITVPLDAEKGTYEIIILANSKIDKTKKARISIFTNVWHVLEHINITPSFLNMTADQVMQFKAVGYDDEWNLVQISPIWSVNGGGTINQNGVFNATTVGTWKIYASFLGIKANATVNITHGKIVEINVYPKDIILNADEEQYFVARARDYDSNIWNATSDCNWEINDPKGEITDNIYYPGKAGNWTIKASISSIFGISNVSVEHGELNYIIIEPKFKEVMKNDTIQFKAKGYDRDGNEFLIFVEWGVNSGGIIDDNGLFTAKIPGNWTIYANYSGIIGYVNVTVLSPPPIVVDKILPKIISTYPLDKSVNIPINTKISITFSEEMDSESVKKAIKIFPYTKLIFKAMKNKRTYIFKLSNNLEYNKTYTVTIKNTAKDLANNSLEHDFSFSFKTELLGKIKGRVLDENGLPIQGAIIFIENTNFNSATNNNGIYTIENIPKGNYTIVIKKEGYKIEKKEIDVIAGNITNVPDIKLQRIQQKKIKKMEREQILIFILPIIIAISFTIFLKKKVRN